MKTFLQQKDHQSHSAHPSLGCLFVVGKERNDPIHVNFMLIIHGIFHTHTKDLASLGVGGTILEVCSLR